MCKLMIVCLLLVATLLGSSVLFSADLLAIGKILSDPKAFGFHTVMLQGVAHNIQFGKGGHLGQSYCFQTFILDDGTGSIEVEYTSFCAAPGEAFTPLSDGDHVNVEAFIQAYGNFPKGAGDNAPTTRIWATTSKIIRSGK